MTFAIFLKLLAIFAIVVLGWVASRARWLGPGDPSRVLANAAFFLFIPALLFRTTARLDISAMPWATLAAFFLPVLGFMLGLYVVQRRSRPVTGEHPPAEPSVRAITATFGNTVQLGIPLATALFGEVALSVHLAIVSLHALLLLTLVTTLVELDLARAHARRRGVSQSLSRTLLTTVRNTIIHPVVLPVLAGLLFNLAGLSLPALVDETLQLLAQAVVPICLVVIGMSLAHYGLQGALRGALAELRQTDAAPGAGAGVGPLGRWSARHAIGGDRGVCRAARRLERAAVRATLRDARSRGHGEHRDLDGRLRADGAAVAAAARPVSLNQVRLSAQIVRAQFQA